MCDGFGQLGVGRHSVISLTVISAGRDTQLYTFIECQENSGGGVAWETASVNVKGLRLSSILLCLNTSWKTWQWPQFMESWSLTSKEQEAQRGGLPQVAS